jgi:hypothetical protein
MRSDNPVERIERYQEQRRELSDGELSKLLQWVHLNQRVANTARSKSLSGSRIFTLN